MCHMGLRGYYDPFSCHFFSSIRHLYLKLLSFLKTPISFSLNKFSVLSFVKCGHISVPETSNWIKTTNQFSIKTPNLVAVLSKLLFLALCLGHTCDAIKQKPKTHKFIKIFSYNQTKQIISLFIVFTITHNAISQEPIAQYP